MWECVSARSVCACECLHSYGKRHGMPVCEDVICDSEISVGFVYELSLVEWDFSFGPGVRAYWSKREFRAKGAVVNLSHFAIVCNRITFPMEISFVCVEANWRVVCVDVRGHGKWDAWQFTFINNAPGTIMFANPAIYISHDWNLRNSLKFIVIRFIYSQLADLIECSPKMYMSPWSIAEGNANSTFAIFNILQLKFPYIVEIYQSRRFAPVVVNRFRKLHAPVTCQHRKSYRVYDVVNIRHTTTSYHLPWESRWLLLFRQNIFRCTLMRERFESHCNSNQWQFDVRVLTQYSQWGKKDPDHLVD